MCRRAHIQQLFGGDQMKRLIALAILMVWIALPALADGLTATFVDVGAADCALFVSDGEAMMIDTGETQANFGHIKNVMDSQGIHQLKYLVLTHPHADHIGNACNVLQTFQVDQVIMPPIEQSTAVFNDFMKALKELGTNTSYPEVGDKYQLGSAEVTVYGPHPVAYANPNDWSIVMMVHAYGRSILMTGDIEASAEEDLVAANETHSLRADVLKVPHHGSDTSSTLPFVQAVAPIYAIVSCASDTTKNYPSTDVAMTLTSCGTQDILTTEMLGDIQITIDSESKMSIQAAKIAHPLSEKIAG